MSTGNYDFDNFVRVDCALPPDEFWINAVHETAHFTLTKCSFYGLLCFFLRQDARDARSPFAHSLLRLEQAFECVNECYARTKELLLCTKFSIGSQTERARILEGQRGQPYYARYHMERMEPLLLQYETVSRSPVFPDFLFLMAANADISPLLETDLTDPKRVLSRILAQSKELYPDDRLQQLIETFLRLVQRLPAEKITVRRLAQESGLTIVKQSAKGMFQFFSQLEHALSFRPEMKELLAQNRKRMEREEYPLLTEENLAYSYQQSLTDCVIPALLHDRFRREATKSPVFRPEKTVLTIYMEPERLLPPRLVQKHSLPLGDRSAFLQFKDTKSGISYSGAFAKDVTEFRRLLDLYPGAVYLYLDDYARYQEAGGFRSKPVFFRTDVPWDELETEMSTQGARIERFFLQRYSDSVFFFFGFDLMENIIFSMLAFWELKKILSAVQTSRIAPCVSHADCYGALGWEVFRDVIAGVTEDIQFGQLTSKSFRQLRML